jgi:transposase InsO family protein
MDWRIPEKLKKGVSYARFSIILRSRNGNVKRLVVVLLCPHYQNLKAALALYFAWYNFCRVHSSLRVTPAMEARLTNHIWSFAELLAA